MKFEKKEIFDNIISLGVNCENTFVIQELFGNSDSSLFTWAFIQDPFMLPEYINNPGILFAEGMTLTPSKMFRCERTKFVFHSKMQKEDHLFDTDEVLPIDKLKEAEEEVRSRVGHLADKFWKRINSAGRNLFVIKLFSYDEYKNKIIPLLAALTDLLDKKSVNKNFMLMCVLEDGYAQPIEQEMQDERLMIKRIRKFSHNASADQFDKEAWKEIYRDIRIKTT